MDAHWKITNNLKIINYEVRCLFTLCTLTALIHQIHAIQDTMR